MRTEQFVFSKEESASLPRERSGLRIDRAAIDGSLAQSVYRKLGVSSRKEAVEQV